MSGYQKLTLVGNVGADPTVTQTEWGPVTNFDIAVNGRNNPPIWYSVSAWGKLGEAMAQYLSKGREVLVESNQFEPVWWTDRRTREVVTRINVTASRVVFLDGGAPEHKSANPQQRPSQHQPQQQVSQQRQQATPQVSQQRQQATPQQQQATPQRQQVSQQRQQATPQQQQATPQRQQVSQQQQVGEHPEIPF